MTAINLTKELENRKMLAALLDIDEEDAGLRLEVGVLVTAARDDESSLKIAAQVEVMLNRTVRASSQDAFATLAAVEVIVGPAVPRTTGAKIWVGSVSEGIRVAREPFLTVGSKEHWIFGLIAACYACGMALRFALGRGHPLAGSDRILISPLELLGADLELIYLPCDLGEAVLAGAGAVGNGFLYGLQHFQTAGRLHIVDPKRVHDGILNRCVWFSPDDIGEPKAMAIVRRAQAKFSSLELIPCVAAVRELAASVPSPGIARLITTVDSRRARRSLQTEIPREVFDASTTGIAEVVLHFNQQPSSLACLACIYRQEEGELKHEAHVAEALGVSVEDVKEGFINCRAAERLCVTFPDLKPEDVLGKAYDTLFKARCAQGKLLAGGDRQVLAPFCFVSMLAGAYLALELVRRVNSGRIAEPYNYWRISPWHNPVTALRSLRARARDCQYCADALMRKTATDLWGFSSDSLTEEEFA